MSDQHLSVRPFARPDCEMEAAAAWDSWVPVGHFTMSDRFLRSAAHVQMPDYRLEPLLLCGPEGEACGVASAYWNLLDGAEMGGEAIQRGVRRLRYLLPGLLRFRVIEIGNPAALAFPLRTTADVCEGMGALARWGMDAARCGKAQMVVIRDFEEDAEPGSSAVLAGLDFVPVPLPALFVAPLTFASFADYRAAMRTRYRSRLDMCMKDTADLFVEILDEFDHLAGELHALWRGLYDRAKRYHRVVLTDPFFRSVSKLSEVKLLLLRRRDASIAGFGLLFLDGPVLRYSATGFTREAALQEGVYFRMLYEVIRFGIENGFDLANLGATTAGPKMSIGAQPIRLQAWMWHPSSLHRRALGWLMRAIMQPAEPVVRNVFRDPVQTRPDPALAGF